MSIGADATDRPADVAPPTKMPRLEDALRVKKISEHAVLPVRGSDGAAGYDLASAYDYGASPRPNRPDPTSRPASERDATERDRSGSVGRSGKIRRSLPRGRFFSRRPSTPARTPRARSLSVFPSSDALARPLASSPVIPARGKGLVKTDLSIAIPRDTYARIAPRSGLAWKHFIDTGAGVVDYDYRGNVGVILFNHAETDFEVKAGDRVAQLILERIATPEVVEVDDLEATERGAGGFGSTGVQGAAAK
jgi:dUTP pyrophosphatase